VHRRGEICDAERSGGLVDETEVRIVFQASWEPLLSRLERRVGSRQVAEDALSEAFVRALVRRRSLERYEDLEPWLLRVALNVVRDGSRRESRFKRFISSGSRANQELSQSDIADGVATRYELGAELQDLPEQQRSVVNLYYLEGHSVRETAELMNLSAGTVKAHLHAARARLRDSLRSSEYGRRSPTTTIQESQNHG
jgi:RNA polymerase sigma-70 factor, ECF subfamily